MKNIFIIFLFSFVSIFANAQITQYLGGPTTIVETRGTHKVDGTLIPPLDTLNTSPVGSFAIKNNMLFFKTSSGWTFATTPRTTIAKLRASNLTSVIPSYYVVDANKEGVYAYIAGDNTSADNTGVYIVDAAGNRYKRIITSDFINVLWFGAIGDGSTNSTAAIQAAIDFAAGPLSPTRNVYIPQGSTGNYMVDSIKIKNACIIGDNGRTTIAARASSATGLFVLADTPVRKIIIANLRLFGNASNTTQHCFNITAIPQTAPAYTGGMWDSKFDNIEISGFKAHGFHFYCSDGAGDMANQFLVLDHITVTSPSNTTARGLYVEGQMGQLTVLNSEFDGAGSANAGTVAIELKSLLTSNDQIKNVKLNRVTSQAVEKAIVTYFAQVIDVNDCWFENDSTVCQATNKSRVIVQNSNIANVGVNGGYIFGNDGSILDVVNNGVYGAVTARFYTSPTGSPGGGRLVGNYGQDNLNVTSVYVAQNVNVSSNTLNTGYFRDIVTNGTYSKSLYVNTINSNLNPGEEITIRQLDASNPNSFVAFNKTTGNIDIPNSLDSGFLILRNRGTATFKRSDLLNTWVLVGLSQPQTFSDTLIKTGSWFTGEKIYSNNPASGTLYWYCKQGGQPGTWDSVTNAPPSVLITESTASTLTLTTPGDYVFLGSTATWTLPSLASNPGKKFYIIQNGSGNLTVNTSGSDNILSQGATVTTATLVTNSPTLRLVAGPSHWYVE